MNFLVESAAKAQILSHIREHSRGLRPVVTAELTLGRSSTRADLALASDNELIGIEIKTGRDSLRRLSTQMAAYNRFFDHVVLAIEPRHIKAASEIDLLNASLWVIDGKSIEILRHGNPNAVAFDAHLEMMTREERKQLDEKSTPETIRTHYQEIFRQRYGQTSRDFWRAVSRRVIKSDDIKLLSRFRAQREAITKLEHQRAADWNRWKSEFDKIITPITA